MAESDIEVGSTVRYVGFKRNVRDGAEGVVTKFLPPDLFRVSWGRFTMEYARGELELVLPKLSGEAPPLNTIDISDNSDPRPLKDAVNVIVDESGPGIAARNLQAPPRPRRRHQTTSWDPDMPLPDADARPGRRRPCVVFP